MFPHIDPPSNPTPLHNHHSKLMQGLITNEIYHSTSTSAPTATAKDVGMRKWFKGGADYDKFFKSYNDDFERKKLEFKGADLTKIHATYTATRTLQTTLHAQKKLTLIFTLSHILQTPPYTHLRLAGTDTALYESMFKIAPGKHISRPNFLTVLRCVYGFDIANIESVSSSYMLSKLNLLYTVFDLNDNGCMDYRQMILLLHMCTFPTFPAIAHIKFGYALYSSSGSYDESCIDSNSMKLGDCKGFILAMVQSEVAENVGELLDEAWRHVAVTDSGARGRLIKFERKQAKYPDITYRMEDIQITYTILTHMLHSPSLLDMFQTARVWGKHDSGTWTCVMEDVYYPQVLKVYIMSERRAVKVAALAITFVQMQSKRRKIAVMKVWRYFIWRRKRMRFLISDNVMRYTITNTSNAFTKLRAHAVRVISVISIQRVIRGHIGRLEAAFLHILQNSVVLLQAVYRGKVVRRHYLGITRLRIWGATEIARYVRGGIGRRIALSRLEGYVEIEREGLKRKRYVWENEAFVNAIVVIQRNYRKATNRRRIHLIQDKTEREVKVLEMMEDAKEVVSRQRKVYETQLINWYKQIRVEVERSRDASRDTKREKEKIVRHRRKIKENEKKFEAKIKAVAEDKLEEEKVAVWIETWSKKAEIEAAAYIVFCRDCLDHAETRAEKALSKQVRKTIKVQAEDVLRRADAKGLKMETAEGVNIATEEVLFMIKEEKKKEVMDEMQVEAKIYEEKENVKKVELNGAKRKQEGLNRLHAANVIANMCRLWYARRLLIEKVHARFTKEFNVQYNACYYVDKVTKGVSWVKPICLGNNPNSDLIVSPNWVVMRDNEGYPYYYSPRSLEMQWKFPHGCTRCECEVKESWKYGYPSPIGRCAEFAIKRESGGDKKFFCLTCWEEGGKRRARKWRACDGGLVGSKVVDYDGEMVEDFVDFEEEAVDDEWRVREELEQERIEKEQAVIREEERVEGLTVLEKAMEVKVEVTKDSMVKRAESLTLTALKRDIPTNRSLVNKYADWAKAGGRLGVPSGATTSSSSSAALAGAVEKWSAINSAAGKYAHFTNLRDDKAYLKVAFGEWIKFRRAARYDRQMFSNGGRHGESVAGLLERFGIWGGEQGGVEEGWGGGGVKRNE